MVEDEEFQKHHFGEPTYGEIDSLNLRLFRAHTSLRTVVDTLLMDSDRMNELTKKEEFRFDRKSSIFVLDPT